MTCNFRVGGELILITRFHDLYVTSFLHLNPIPAACNNCSKREAQNTAPTLTFQH